MRVRTTLALCCVAAPALAQPLPIELNRLEPRDTGCRVWFVLGPTPAGPGIDPLRLDLVLFGRDGVVARRVAVELGPLPPARTLVRIFDVAGLPCEGVGHLLLNDIPACGAAAGCADRAALASRVPGVEFRK